MITTSVEKWLPVVCAAKCGVWRMGRGMDNEPGTCARLTARSLGLSPDRHVPQHGAVCALECCTRMCLENYDEMLERM